MKVKIGDRRCQLGAKIGTGKEGEVYAVKNHSKIVVKKLDSRNRNEKRRKIRWMVDNLPKDPVNDQSRLPSFIWPQNTVSHNGEFIGYSMPRLKMDKLRNIQKYASDVLSNTPPNKSRRYQMAQNLAIRVGAVHANGHAMGDMHHLNILTEGKDITLIDCDGFHISAGYTDFGGKTTHPRYTIDSRAENDDVKQIQLSDRLGLAIHIFQILMEGSHPFVAVGPDAVTGSIADAMDNEFPYGNTNSTQVSPPDHAPQYEWIDSSIRNLFKTAFVDGKTNPQDRPTAEEWAISLNEQFDSVPRRADRDSLESRRKRVEWDSIQSKDDSSDDDRADSDGSSRPQRDSSKNSINKNGSNSDRTTNTSSLQTIVALVASMLAFIFILLVIF